MDRRITAASSIAGLLLALLATRPASAAGGQVALRTDDTADGDYYGLGGSGEDRFITAYAAASVDPSTLLCGIRWRQVNHGSPRPPPGTGMGELRLEDPGKPGYPDLLAGLVATGNINLPLIFLLFLFPAVVYGLMAGTVRSARDVIAGMTKAMGTMSYYIVLAFFAALFTDAFGRSNIGALVALKGATFLQELGLPGQVTIVGIILVTATVNLLSGSASAKWALLAPIFVPMLMQVGLAPELTQAAYRVGDSSTNIITPLMPYFPLVVVFCQRYVKHAGIGTLASLMLPYSVTFLVAWTLYLLAYWALGLPLGVQSAYTHP